MGKEWMTVKEAAEYLGVSTSTIRNWKREGKLKDCQPKTFQEALDDKSGRVFISCFARSEVEQIKKIREG